MSKETKNNPMLDPGPGYVSKEEKKIEINDPSGKWSDLTLLPEWAEQYYDVFTARKHGKWVMLKALKPEYANDPEMREMLEREFETRYNLAHPNIAMVNDLEIVPGAGLAIITDDVYGYSLRRLIDERRLTPKIVHRLETQLLDAMQYIQENHVAHHPITPDTIIFTEYQENLKLINVGYAQKNHLSEHDTRSDIESYGKVLSEVLDHLPAKLPKLRRVASRAMQKDRSFPTITDVRLAVQQRQDSQIYLFLCIFILIMAGILVWLSFRS